MNAEPSTRSETGEFALPEIPDWLCLTLLAMLILSVIANELFAFPERILSDPHWDLNYFFLHWRAFGFDELKQGHLALWNPYCSSGSPFFGNFQSALLYPLNFLYLLLPLPAAINWTIALHLWLGGAFMFYWVRERRLHSLACLLAAAMFVFCGPHFLQIQTGHLPNLCTLIWAPLLLLAIDKMFNRPGLAPALLGTFAFAMSILAGHPQYVFYLGVGAGIYSFLKLRHAPRRGPICVGLAAIVLGGVALTAVQLFTGVQESGESIRSVGMSYEFASEYSFPPENFFTFVAPWLFGDVQNVPYWGRWYITEVSAFVSVTGLVLALYGITQGPPEKRRFSATLLILSLVLALGGYTPIFKILFYCVPGFNKFRGMDKFLWLAAIFLCQLAAVGMDTVMRRGVVTRRFVLGTMGCGFTVCLLTILPAWMDWWISVLKFMHPKGSTALGPGYFTDPKLLLLTSHQASQSLLWGGLALFAVAILLHLTRDHRGPACGVLLLLAGIELLHFASTSVMSFVPAQPYSPAMLAVMARHPGDDRIKHANPNAAMSYHFLDFDGDDPSGLLRYKRFMDFSVGLDPDTTDFDVMPQRDYDTNLGRMVRCRYYFADDDRYFTEVTNVLPRLSLVNHFRVLTNYHDIFTALTNAQFNLADEVILESQPDPAPSPGMTRGTVKLLSSKLNSFDVEAETSTPTLLFITDAYAKGWRALAQTGSDQDHYQILPANYCLQAIPLKAGHHLIHLEYSPFGFRLGCLVSGISLAVFLALCAVAVKYRRRII